MTSKEVNQLKVEKGISVEKQMLQEIRENFDPYEKRLPGVKHLRKQKSKDESQRSNLLRTVYFSIISCQTVKTVQLIDYTGCIDVGDGCWRRNVTNIQKVSPISKFCHQHPKLPPT